MINIMVSIPPNTSWIERRYSLLEMIRKKRSHQMAIETIQNLLFPDVNLGLI